MAASEKIAALKNRIDQAFDDAALPQTAPLISHDCEECRQLERDFAGVDWRRADAARVERNYDKLPLLTPAAFHFLLPAFLLYTLERFDAANDVGEFTLYALAPGKDWNRDERRYWTERLKLFTGEQMEAIFEFLDLMRENPVYAAKNYSVGSKIQERLKSLKAAAEG